ncbi:MAG: tetratricopeptide repeat protein [Limimaricola sp.]|uniref:tetratricopeptide repeat protein n=1 Tax=Limimaricola sp. TaxID=2211665 RepID=UPI001DB8D4D6|nr:tetratricopeptide repeat protein [Limimaricola sp.]MBI1416151.1 tetratricopeptide repeat protein [Limimaricola sp.]
MAIRRRGIKYIVTALGLCLALVPGAWADQARLDQLFDQLKNATPENHDAIEKSIYDAWSQSGSATIDLLLKRGQDALQAGDAQAAVEHFTAAIDHAPDFAEAYDGRASAYFQLDLVGPALDDLRQTLVLNPRHFGAMRGIAIIMEEIGNDRQALAVYQAALALDPMATDVQDAITRLQQKLEGRAL